MNKTIEITKNYKQMVELNDKLVAQVNNFINLSIQLLASPSFHVELTTQNILDILMEREDDPIFIDNVVCSDFSLIASIADFVKNFFMRLTITEGEIEWLSPLKIVEVAEKIS